jgi:hypothetical protein
MPNLACFVPTNGIERIIFQQSHERLPPVAAHKHTTHIAPAAFLARIDSAAPTNPNLRPESHLESTGWIPYFSVRLYSAMRALAAA